MKFFKLKNTLRILYKFVLIIALLNIFAYSVRHVVVGGTKLGFLTSPLKKFTEFPLLVKKIIHQIQTHPYHIVKDTTFNKINLLKKDIYALNAHFDKNKYIYQLNNLRNDSIISSWSYDREYFQGTSEKFVVSQPLNPILLEDGSIIGLLHGSYNLFRLDKNSKLVWQNNSREFHHSLNLSHDKHLWVCSWKKSYTRNEHSNDWTKFEDDVLCKIDIETGEVVFEKQLSEIFISNGYINMVHGYGNEEKPNGLDVFHLNDIEPILEDGEFWKKGDLLLSLRHRSMIVHYRPKTNKILRFISGSFLSQHDVDVISDHEVSIFNNNRTCTKHNISQLKEEVIDNTQLVLKSSNVIVYSFRDSTFTRPFIEIFEKEKIYTPREGVHKFLQNGDLFVESTLSGKIYIIRDNELILKKYINKVTKKGTVEYPHWVRIYENINF